ncbi:MAG: hypothetical protein ACFB0B_01605 [Thermonemataceae bacterium]
MRDTLTTMIAALKILKEEDSNSKAIGILEDGLKALCKQYVMDMSAMAGIIGMKEVEEEVINGLKLLQILNKKDEENT